MSDTLKRIKQYIEYKGLNVRTFEISVGFSNGSFASQLKHGRTIGVDKLENILKIYSELDANWLLTGKGKMLLEKDIWLTEEPQATYNTPESEKEMIEILKNQIEDLKKDKDLLHNLLEAKMGKGKTD